MTATKEKHGNLASKKDTNKNILSRFFQNNTDISKTKDDDTLIDVHVGNPLRKITELLEDIKKQKAFSFSFKGSLGAAGILLILATFGIFGGTRAFCSKGVQSHMGHVYVLDIVEDSGEPSILERAVTIWDAVTGKPVVTKTVSNRAILIRQDQAIFHLKGELPNIFSLQKIPVIVTGGVDSCSQTISLDNPQNVQVYAP